MTQPDIIEKILKDSKYHLDIALFSGGGGVRLMIYAKRYLLSPLATKKFHTLNVLSEIKIYN